MNAKEIRQEAKQNLKGKWQKAIIISVIYTAIIFVLTLLTNKVMSIFGIVEFVIIPALTYGIAHSYYHLRKGDEVGYVDFLTVGFKNFGRAWGVAWEIIKKTWWCILLAILPLIVIVVLLVGTIFAGVGANQLKTKPYLSGYGYSSSARSTYDHDALERSLSNYNYSNNSSSNIDSETLTKMIEAASVGAIAGIGIAFIIYIALIVFLAIRMLLYVLTYYIAVIKEDATPKDARVESETLMKGNRGRYFCLMLSFFGWFFLVGFVAGFIGAFVGDTVTDIISEIGIAILNPYIAFATIGFYEALSNEKNINGQNNAQINANNTTNVPNA